jgi:hypothetical protein
MPNYHYRHFMPRRTVTTDNKGADDEDKKKDEQEKPDNCPEDINFPLLPPAVTIPDIPLLNLDAPGCVGISHRLYEKEYEFINTFIGYNMILVRVGIEIGAGARVILDFGVRLCLFRKEIGFALAPAMVAIVKVTALVDLFIIKGGIEGRVLMMDASLLPLATFAITPSGAFQACLRIDMAIKPLVRGRWWWR